MHTNNIEQWSEQIDGKFFGEIMAIKINILEKRRAECNDREYQIKINCILHHIL